MKFSEFLNVSSKIKNIPLPAEASQFKMSPPFRKELIAKYREQMRHARKAGVMALVYPDKKEIARMALILRKTYHGVHSAQIGFPGGKLEPSDKDLQDAAIRETWEEIGVRSHEMKVLAQLTEVYIPPSNFYVQPFLGISTHRPNFVKQDDEVEDIVEVLLEHLLDDSRVVLEKVPTSMNALIEVPAFKLNGHIVWGATAMMLSEIKDLLKAAF